MILLLADRFLACIYPIHYKVWFSKGRTIGVSVLAWITGLLNAIICPIVGIKEFRAKTTLIYFSFTIVTLLASNFVYIAIGFKLRNRPIQSNHDNNTGRFTKVALLIMVTFLVFLAIPDMIAFMIKKDEEDFLTNVWIQLAYLIGNINYCIDPLIYVFGYQPVKSVFIQKMSKLCPCYSQVSTVGVVDRIQNVSKMVTPTKRDINI